MKKITGIVIVAFALAACKPSNAPKYPAGADGITRMRLDSARYFMDRHNSRRAMIQLKAAEKHLPEVNEDSLKFVTYLSIAQINAQNGAYKMALTYYLGAEKHANDVKRSHRLADVFLGKAAVYNQMGMRDSASLWVKKRRKVQTTYQKRPGKIYRNTEETHTKQANFGGFIGQRRRNSADSEPVRNNARTA